jgi:CDP-glycerol glycerophosphotransferase (TagB/SpsB family)
MFAAKAKRLVRHALGLPLYWFSFLIPRQQNLWIFGAWFGRRYADNSRHLFEYIYTHQCSIRAVWLSHEREIIERLRSRGYEAYLINSWAGYWLSCQASLVVVSTGGADVNRVGISRARGLQLFHGIPLKKIMLDDKVTMHRNLSTVRRLAHWAQATLFPFTNTRVKWDAIISTSPVVSRRFMSAYGVDESRIAITGYPRNDILLHPDPPAIPAIEKVKENWGAEQVICYVPTHRGEGQKSMDVLFSTLRIEALEDCLARHNAVLLMKTHFYHRDSEALPGLARKPSRIYWLSGSEAPDLNSLLPFVDVMITDYSSAYIDYLLLDRPIIFAPFDLEEYLAADREFYEDYESVTPGPRCANWEAVIRALDEVLTGNDQYQQARAAERAKYHAFTDAYSCQRVFKLAHGIVSDERV